MSRRFWFAKSGAASNTIAFDSFTRADNASVPGNTETGNFPWAANGAGAWGISSNKLAKQHTAADAFCKFDCGVANNIKVEVTFTASGAQDWGVIVRADGTDNDFWMVQTDGTNTAIYQRVGSVYTQRATVVNSFTTGDVLRVDVIGNVFSAYKNDVSLGLTFNSADYNTKTQVGIYTGTNQNNHRWDNFTVTDIS